MNHSRRSLNCRVPLAFAWSHSGVQYRVSPWPEVQFERCYGSEWVSVVPSTEALRAAVRGGRGAWSAYLEFVPADVRELLECFRTNRLLALQVASRCPEIVGVLTETPALTAFLAEQASLVGGGRWHEVNAVFERNGVFGLLEWLGLPARRETLAILRNIVTADLGASLLQPLRRILWAPEGIFALAQLTVITDRDVVERCHALAA